MTTAEHKRAGAMAHCAMLIAYGPTNIGYEFGGGLDWINTSMVGAERRFKAGAQWTPDCRASVLWVCKWSGWKSPTGMGWIGNSESMWRHLPHFSNVADCGHGTIVTYGPQGDEHVAMVIQPDGDNPWLMSHGSAYTNNHIRYQDLTAYFANRGMPVTLCGVGGLVH